MRDTPLPVPPVGGVTRPRGRPAKVVGFRPIKISIEEATAERLDVLTGGRRQDYLRQLIDDALPVDEAIIREKTEGGKNFARVIRSVAVQG